MPNKTVIKISDALKGFLFRAYNARRCGNVGQVLPDNKALLPGGGRCPIRAEEGGKSRFPRPVEGEGGRRPGEGLSFSSPRAGEVARSADGGSCVNNTPLPHCAVLSPQGGQRTAHGFTARSVIPQACNAGYSGRSAFTLIELLVVILIIAILAAIALPQYQRAVEKSNAVEAQLILRAVYQEAQLYFLTHGVYPSSFTELDSAPAWTGREKYYEYAGNVADVRSNGNWSLNLFKEGNMSIARLAGPYKGAGFYINLTADNYPKHKMMCFEATAVSPMIQVRFTREKGDYCNKILHADWLPGTDGHKFYLLH